MRGRGLDKYKKMARRLLTLYNNLLEIHPLKTAVISTGNNYSILILNSDVTNKRHICIITGPTLFCKHNQKHEMIFVLVWHNYTN